MKIIEKEFNLETGEETITERDLTSAELAEFQAAQAERESRAQSELDKVAKKATAEAKLAALGLDADDLRALGL